MRQEALLRDLGLDEAAFLGSGAEARVYALDEARVVRVVDPRTTPSYLERIHAFCRGLRRERVPYALPEPLELGEHDSGVRYTIERRIPGRDVLSVLDALTGSARERAISGYVEAALRVRDAGMEEPAFHLPIAEPEGSYPTFAALLRARVARSGSLRDDELRQRLPAWDVAFEAWRVPDSDAGRSLVHGDYFPGNVMAMADGRITGVIDFSNLTMYGDPRLDLVSAITYLRVLGTWSPRDEEVARAAVPARENLEACWDAYQVFYALYFAPFAYRDDPDLFVWCEEILSRFGGGS